jgi:DNA-binding transcriptional MerR regulator
MRDELRGGGIGIAELARRAGVTPRTIRYYVAEGLLPAPGGRGQRRAYGAEHLDRLATIQALKAAYLPLHEIRRRLDAGSDLTRQPAAPPGEGEQVGASRDRPGAGKAGRFVGNLHGAVSREPAPTEPGSVGAGFHPTMPSSRAATLPAFPAAAPTHTDRQQIGVGPSQGVGRIEIYDPPETVWHRHVLAQGVELHFQETSDPRLAEAIRRLIREADAILDGRTST